MRYCPEVLSGWRIHENNIFKKSKNVVCEKEIWLVEQIKNGLQNNLKERDIFINNLLRQKHFIS